MNGFQWWCAAQSTPWSWDWRGYPGVWVFVALLVYLYRDRFRVAGAVGARAAAFAGIACVWLALDWPIGALGSGYLASVHMVQYLLLALIAPPLLLLGLPGERRRAIADGRAGSVLRVVTHPLIALAIFVTTFLASHAPPVTDRLMATQVGSFVLDVAWLGSGLLFWWQIVGAPPGRSPLAPPLKAGYLFLGSLAHTPVAMWLILASYPVYATYELAPPIGGWLSPLEDQQVAGGLMLTVGAVYILTVVTVILYRWMGTGEEPRNAAADA